MNRCNVYVAGICVEVIASYLISIPQSQIVSAGYRHQKILICNTIQNHSIDFLHTLRIRSGVQFCENFRILKESRELAKDRITIAPGAILLISVAGSKEPPAVL